MYVPPRFQESDQEALYQFIRANPFALLVTTGPLDAAQAPLATHLPIELQPDSEGKLHLVGHLAKANPQWKTLGTETPALVVFSGPHAYISSSWYDHVNVPTWNYLAVQVTGRTRLLTDDETLTLLHQQLGHYEANSRCPVSVASMTEAYVRQEMRGLVGFSLQIETIQGAAKLSQNRDDKNHAAIVEELKKQNDFNANQVAEEMIRRR
jgi:transcriptional regulator